MKNLDIIGYFGKFASQIFGNTDNMSKNIESFSLQMEMREDLMACYREVAPNCITQNGAWRRTINHPAKRFYVTAKQAAQRASKYLRGDTSELDSMKPLRRKMWLELIKIVEEVSQEPEHQGKSLRKICEVAIRRPAPRFYIGIDLMKKIFTRCKYNRYDKDGRLKKDYEKKIGVVKPKDNSLGTVTIKE